MSELKFKVFDYTVMLPQQKQLFAESFPEVFEQKPEAERNYERGYKWQYRSYPAAKNSYEYMASIADEMVGYYAALPYVYKIGGSTFTSGMVCGVMTSPHHRKAGIFSRLGNYAAQEQKESGVDFNLTFPIRKAVMPGFMRMGWQVGFEMPLYIRFLKSDSLLRSKKIPLIAPLVNIGLKVYNSVLKKKDRRNIMIEAFDQFADIRNYGEFISAYEQTVPNTLRKDIDFSTWRYGAPEAEYIFLCAYRDQHLIGFVSLRSIVREGVPSFGIVDFMVTDENCINTLHNAVNETAKRHKKEAVMTMMSKYSAGKYRMLSNGYLKSPFKFHFIFKNLSGKIPQDQLLNERNWHLMFVDTDDL